MTARVPRFDAHQRGLPEALHVPRIDASSRRDLGDLGAEYTVTLTDLDVVLEYPWGAELRLASEFGSPEFLEALSFRPVSFFHPTAPREDGELEDVMITPSNWVEFGRGIIRPTPWVEGKKLRARILVSDAVTDEAFRDGTLPAVSLGTFVVEDRTPGRLDGVRYDVVQRNPMPNHVAGVTVPRSPGARVDENDGENMSKTPPVIPPQRADQVSPEDFQALLRTVSDLAASVNEMRGMVETMQAAPAVPATPAIVTEPVVEPPAEIADEMTDEERTDALADKVLARVSTRLTVDSARRRRAVRLLGPEAATRTDSLETLMADAVSSVLPEMKPMVDEQAKGGRIDALDSALNAAELVAARAKHDGVTLTADAAKKIDSAMGREGGGSDEPRYVTARRDRSTRLAGGSVS